MKNWILHFIAACRQEIFFKLWTWKTDWEMHKYKKHHPRPKTTKGHP